MRWLILSQYNDLRAGLTWEDFGALTTVRAREFWMCWRRFSWLVIKQLIVNQASSSIENNQPGCPGLREVQPTRARLGDRLPKLRL